MSEKQTLHPDRLMELTADVVAAYVSNNPVPVAEVPTLIDKVNTALKSAVNAEADQVADPLRPAVPIRKSVTQDHIICLEDGKKFKSLKRHLSTHYNMTPEEYRAKWGLDPHYPMVAPSYAAARSALAKSTGLGRKRGEQKTAAKIKRSRVKSPDA